MENRLTADQLAALAPGDTVTIESGAEFGRSRFTPGTVVRVDASHVVVRCEGPRGRGTYIERYGRRDGVRRGGGRAELINPDGDEPAARDLLRRRTQQIDVAYREWSRRRADVDALRQLHTTISDYLDEALID
jgi:ribosome maturation factor RimP